tara:strand:- start:885 stop:2465 length:1581 start_codon:yes stop_codon:yes gene_type:complete
MANKNLESIKNKNSLFFSTLKEERSLLKLLTIIIAGLILWPLFNLIGEGLNGLKNGSVNLGLDGLKQIRGTFFLLFGSLSLGGIIGTANGWILANCKFKGREFLRITQLTPLAIPAYLLSAILIDLGSINGIRIHGMGWGIVIMALTTYPYVFLLSTESFAICAKKQLEACRTLGVGPWNSFLRVGLPMTIPAIGAGLALMGMEVINELGAVQLLNIPTISAGIVENWMSENNPSGAIGLALIALIIVISLVAFERILRRKSRRWSEGLAGEDSPKWELKGTRAILSQLLCGIPPTLALGIPIFWAISNADQIKQGLNLDLMALTIRSLSIGLIAACITLFSALFISVLKRWDQSKIIKSISFASGIGYAIPGVVVAISLFSFGGIPWNLSPIVLLIWGYLVRFLAVAKGGIDAAFERIPPNIDEAATGLGSNWPKVLGKIHLPLLKGPLTVGFLLVFVDTLKELPLTFVLRPFDFDTLSVRIFQYAGDERMAESLLPAMIIIFLGLLASSALIPTLDKSKKGNFQ